jgi:hypothetical protein
MELIYNHFRPERTIARAGSNVEMKEDGSEKKNWRIKREGEGRG